MPDWPHAPLHRLDERGTYIVTAGTYGKAHHFATRGRLDLLQQVLLDRVSHHGWALQAWAIFSNHYHFVAASADSPVRITTVIREVHSITAREINRLDGSPGRKVWHNYWDTRLTFEESYLARLKYVMNNPVRHGLAPRAELYAWCSAAWFERSAERQFHERVMAMRCDAVRVEDGYEPTILTERPRGADL